jgi:HPt (histidine-containing phosphotransfer) domain-containing protein
MHPCAALLDEAIALAQQERQALAEEDVDKLEELAHRRADLLNDAWGMREGYAQNVLLEHLQKMRLIHEQLQNHAETLRDKLAEQISVERKQAKYLDGFHNADAQSQKAYYFDKRS